MASVVEQTGVPEDMYSIVYAIVLLGVVAVALRWPRWEVDGDRSESWSSSLVPPLVVLAMGLAPVILFESVSYTTCVCT